MRHDEINITNREVEPATRPFLAVAPPQVPMPVVVEFLTVDRIHQRMASPRVSSIAAKEIFKLAEQQDYKIKTIKRAKNQLGVTSHLKYDEEGNRTWHWRLNKDGEQEQKEFKFSKPQMPKLPDPKKLWS